jgi:aryl-alcohol dehydrogenase-like predicted oxidoreductase
MADRVTRMQTDRNYRILAQLQSFAEARGHTLVDLALGWLASQPVVGSVIAGATRPEQVEANVKATEWRLTADEVAEVRSIASGRDA